MLLVTMSVPSCQEYIAGQQVVQSFQNCDNGWFSYFRGVSFRRTWILGVISSYCYVNNRFDSRVQMESGDIQQEVLKIVFALKEMNSSLTIMSGSWVNDRPLNPTMLQTFVEELHKLLKKTISFSTTNKMGSTDSPIIECREESFRSQSYKSDFQEQQQQTKESKPSYQIRVQNDSNQDTEIDVSELVHLNHELSQENEQLTRRLQQAGARILSIQDELQSQIQFLKQAKSAQTKKESSLTWENRRLEAQIQKVEHALAQNNRQFIQEIQKYNERMWKMERQTQALKTKILSLKGMIQDRDYIVSKLKLRNMDLEMLSRGKGRSESRPPTERSKRDAPTLRGFRPTSSDKQLKFLRCHQ